MQKLASLVCLISLFLSCYPKQPEVERIVENGVEVVINHVEPYELKGEATTLRLEEVLSIDTEKDEIAKTGLVNMENIAVDSRGNIFLMLRSSSDDFIFKFNDKGEFITSFCRKGQGPGEAEWGGDIFVDEQDRIIAKDMTKEKVFLFSNDGILMEEIRLDVNQSPSLVEYMGNNIYMIFQQNIDGPDRKVHEELGIGSLDLSDLQVLFQNDFKDALQAERYNPAPRGFIIGITKEHVYIGHSIDEYEIRVLDLKGRLVRKIRKEYTPVAIPEPYMRLTKQNLSRFGRGQELINKLYFPSHWAPFRYAFTDDEGRLYVMTYETDTNANQYRYDVFNADGVFICRISLRNVQVRYVEEERYSDTPRKVIVRGDKLYRIGEKDSGFMELKVYEMIWE